jgi:small multidrug resistance pump
MKHYLFLATAIIFETIGTSFLKKSEQFSKFYPTLFFILSMATSFYMLTQALKGIPIGIAYAIWSATGIVLISTIGYFVFKEKLDFPAILGMAFIIVGVMIIHLFSKSTSH